MRFQAVKAHTVKLVHPRYSGAITLSGNLADDAKHYQEKQVRLAIEEIQK